jgi:hypothetical protein
MPRTMLDEYHLRFFIPVRLTHTESRAIRRVINTRRFHLGLVRTLQTFMGRYPSLTKVSIKIAA